MKTKKGRRQRKEKSKQVVAGEQPARALLSEGFLGFKRSLAPHYLSSTLESEAGRLTIFFWAFVISFPIPFVISLYLCIFIPISLYLCIFVSLYHHIFINIGYTKRLPKSSCPSSLQTLNQASRTQHSEKNWAGVTTQYNFLVTIL